MRLATDRSGRAPRTWGWTDGRLHDEPQVIREPHARGDGPALGEKSSAPILRAPRTWGWTAAGLDVPRATGESPTHVGMDRGFATSTTFRVGEPHARGDGPMSW